MVPSELLPSSERLSLYFQHMLTLLVIRSSRSYNSVKLQSLRNVGWLYIKRFIRTFLTWKIEVVDMDGRFIRSSLHFFFLSFLWSFLWSFAPSLPVPVRLSVWDSNRDTLSPYAPKHARDGQRALHASEFKVRTLIIQRTGYFLRWLLRWSKSVTWPNIPQLKLGNIRDYNPSNIFAGVQLV